MSMAYLGPSFDIHTGGVDLVFPHHQDEIAQSEAATGVTFVDYWLHCAHLQMGGQKMAKSTGNISRVGETIDRGVSPRALRLALLSAHYRMALSFSDDSLAAASSAIDRLDALLAALVGLPIRRPGRRHATLAPRQRTDGFRNRPRRRPQHLACSGGPFRADPRAEPQNRCQNAIDCGCRSSNIVHSRPGPGSGDRPGHRRLIGTGLAGNAR